ncbi:sensor histidine kinase [Gracilibacillus halotolerans]
MKNQTQSLSNVLSGQFVRTVDLYFEEIERLSLAIFTDSTIQDVLTREESIRDDMSVRNEVFLRLLNHIYPQSSVEGITIYSKDGTIFDYTRNGNLELKFNPTKDKWMEELDELKKNSILFLPPSEKTNSHGEQLKVVSFVRNIYSIPRREQIGTMKIDVNIDVFLQLLETENMEGLEEYVRFLILDNQETVIFDQKRELIGQDANVNLTKINSEPKTEGNLIWNNQTYLYANNYSEYTGWHALVLIDNQFLEYERNQVLLFIVISGAIVIAIIGLISYFVSFTITKPLNTIVDKMRKVEDGDFTNRMKPSGNPEMDVLTRVYNSMLDSINKLITEVYESSITEKNAKISALQSQINPHFLYNTLNVMKSISRIKGVEEVAEISESLSDLFKYSMKGLDVPVSLRAEVEHIDNYIRILQHRFRDRFIFKKQITDEAMDAKIPKLLIQPLIENAVNHGLKNMDSDGEILLHAWTENEQLIIEVRDNGVGMDEQTLERVREESKRKKIIDETTGIGLNNVSQRLRLMYGYRYELTIDSEWEKGSLIRISLPLD